MTADSVTDNKRVARRQRVLKQGKILTPNNMTIIDCSIRDMSEAGARIIVGDQMGVPNEFRFLTMSDNMLRDAKVIWRRQDVLGIHFEGETRRGPPRKW